MVFNETEPSTLLINVTYEPRGSANYQQLAWKYNNHDIEILRNPRLHVQANGALTIDPVMPTDAGYYEVIAIISNDLGCENAVFNVYVECKFNAYVY